MLEFKPVNVAAADELRPHFAAQPYRICEYTVGTMVMWSNYFQAEYAIYNNVVIIKNTLRDGRVAFSFPVGTGDIGEAMCAIDRYCIAHRIPTVFEPTPERDIATIADHYDGELILRFTHDWSDYLYDKDDIIYLTGKKFSAQRNNINKFKKVYLDYTYEEITEENIAEVRAFFSDYMLHSEHKDMTSDYEKLMTMHMIDNFFSLQQRGGFIRAAGQIAALAIGEIVGDTLYVHIEKAKREFQGSSAVINMEFARHNDCEELKFVNREEDMGDMGLRTAKSRYNPIEMLRKYSVTVPQGKGRCCECCED